MARMRHWARDSVTFVTCLPSDPTKSSGAILTAEWHRLTRFKAYRCALAQEGWQGARLLGNLYLLCNSDTQSSVWAAPPIEDLTGTCRQLSWGILS